MTVVVGGVMVGAGLLCLGTAAHGRRALPILAALLMSLAMVDGAFLGFLPPVIWAFALALAGILAAVQLRRSSMRTGVGIGCAGRAQAAPARGGAGIVAWERWTLLGAALAYPAAGWLMLRHDHGAAAAAGAQASGIGVAPPVSSAPHAGHAGSGELFALTTTLAICVLILCLLVCAGGALRRRRRILATEAGGMAAMLLVMLVPVS